MRRQFCKQPACVQRRRRRREETAIKADNDSKQSFNMTLIVTVGSNRHVWSIDVVEYVVSTNVDQLGFTETLGPLGFCLSPISLCPQAFPKCEFLFFGQSECKDILEKNRFLVLR